jgi:hypothetical protein
MDVDEMEEIDNGGGYDCGRDGCRLQNGYYHEHIGSSAETKRDIAQWRQ